MKKVILFVLLLIPMLSQAQRQSRAYLGFQLHDFKSPGGSFVYSFGINKYLGIGVGFDASRYSTESSFGEELNSTVASIYGDVRGRFRINNIEPFAFVQGGYPHYEQKGNFQNAAPTYIDITRKGKYFYGGGIGVSYKIGLVSVFVSYTQRLYHFKYEPSDADINGRSLKDLVENSQSLGIATFGIMF